METGKRDIRNIELQYKQALVHIKNNDILPENKEIIFRYLRDAELGKTILKGTKKIIGKGRLLGCINILKILDKGTNKPFDKVTSEDMDDFILRLQRGETLNKYGKPYSAESQATIKKSLRKFYKWLLGKNEAYPDLVKYIDTSYKQAQIRALDMSQVQRIIDFASSDMQKAFIRTLADSGCRIDEFLNLKIEDVIKKTDKSDANTEDYFMIRINFSKTKPRTISVRLSTKELERWLFVHPFKDNPNSYLWISQNKATREFVPVSYHGASVLCKRLAKRAGITARVFNHLFRHTSITHYCHYLSHAQMCYRYGLSFSTQVLERYIDREGIHEEETAKVMKNVQVSDVTEENASLKTNAKMLQEQLDFLKQQMEQMQGLLMAREGEERNIVYVARAK